jgi:hypothetical protein
MAAPQDAEDLQKRVYDRASEGNPVDLDALLKEHPEVNVDGHKNGWETSALSAACGKGYTQCARLCIEYGADVNAKNKFGNSALHEAAEHGHLSCLELLVQHGADVNCQTEEGLTLLMYCAPNCTIPVAHFLLEQKADIQYRVAAGPFRDLDVLHCAMHRDATDRTPGIAFAFLSCNADAKNVKINSDVSITVRDAHTETYTDVQAFIDEHHCILTRVLSEHVEVDTRVGLTQNGIYQEPLERTLEYLGLSMSKDQMVSTSIDGEGVKRALIPGHLLNANHWFNKYASRT